MTDSAMRLRAMLVAAEIARDVVRNALTRAIAKDCTVYGYTSNSLLMSDEYMIVLLQHTREALTEMEAAAKAP